MNFIEKMWILFNQGSLKWIWSMHDCQPNDNSKNCWYCAQITDKWGWWKMQSCFGSIFWAFFSIRAEHHVNEMLTNPRVFKWWMITWSMQWWRRPSAANQDTLNSWSVNNRVLMSTWMMSPFLGTNIFRNKYKRHDVYQLPSVNNGCSFRHC